MKQRFLKDAVDRNKAQIKAMAALQAKKKRDFDEKQERKNQMRRLAVQEDKRRERNKQIFEELRDKQELTSSKDTLTRTTIVNSRESACKKKVNDLVSRVSRILEPHYKDDVQLKTANRTDFNGRLLDPGKWTMQDFDGKYHKSRIRNEFPVPGTALAVDQYRDDVRADMLADVQKKVDEVGQQATIRARAKEMKVKFDLKIENELRLKRIAGDVEETLDLKQAYRDEQQRLAAAGVQEFFAEACGGAAVNQFLEDVENNRLERVRKVLKAQFNPDDDSHMTDWEKLQQRKQKQREELYPVHNINAADHLYGNTALFKAVQLGLVDMTKLLLQYNANANVINFLGETPVHHVWRSWDIGFVNPMVKYVRIQASLSILKLLIEAGADINSQDSTHGETVLHLAARHGPVEILQFLLEHNIAVDVKNKNNETALDVARSHMPGNVEGKMVRLHAEESAKLIEKWKVVAKTLQMYEFTEKWKEFLSNPHSTLMAQSAQDVLDELVIDQRKTACVQMTRGNFASEVVDQLDPTYNNTTEEERLDELGRRQAIERAQLHRNIVHHDISRPAKRYNKLGIRFDDYLHRGAHPGFDPHKDFRPKDDLSIYCTTKEERREQVLEKRREDIDKTRDEELKVMKTRNPIKWRRHMAAREVLKDSGTSWTDWHGKQLGRCCMTSMIMRSGTNNRWNQLHSKSAPEIQAVRPSDIGKLCNPSQIEGTEAAKQHKGSSEKHRAITVDQAEYSDSSDDESPTNADAAEDFQLVERTPMHSKRKNKEYALPPEKSFAQISDEQTGAEPTKDRHKVRPDHELQAKDLVNPWSTADRKYVSVDGFEQRYSTFPLEGFHTGEDPYRPCVAPTKGTTIQYMT